MKPIHLIVVAVLCVLLQSCEEIAHYPQYSYAVEYYCPDSLQPAMRQWVQETIRAASQHMSGGDYEDPEDLIQAVHMRGYYSFSVRGEGLMIKARENEGAGFVPYCHLQPHEKDIFNQLRKQQTP